MQMEFVHEAGKNNETVTINNHLIRNLFPGWAFSAIHYSILIVFILSLFFCFFNFSCCKKPLLSFIQNVFIKFLNKSAMVFISIPHYIISHDNIFFFFGLIKCFYCCVHRMKKYKTMGHLLIHRTAKCRGNITFRESIVITLLCGTFKSLCLLSAAAFSSSSLKSIWFSVAAATAIQLLHAICAAVRRAFPLNRCSRRHQCRHRWRRRWRIKE